jgi:predicted RNA binding protein YcfA (HicA-like mRNA interferase family)
MSGLRIVDARRMDQLLRTLRFQAVRQKGSHIFYRHFPRADDHGSTPQQP